MIKLSQMNLQKVIESIRTVPDFPKKGILFYDVTTAFKNPKVLEFIIDEIVELYKGKGITKVVGIEARGFILASAIAQKLNAGFVPIRKPCKLPAEKVSETYELEYGSDTIEIHKDAIEKDDVVLLHDDLLATGGTAKAACHMLQSFGPKEILVNFFIELSFLPGREKLTGFDCTSLIKFDS